MKITNSKLGLTVTAWRKGGNILDLHSAFAECATRGDKMRTTRARNKHDGRKQASLMTQVIRASGYKMVTLYLYEPVTDMTVEDITLPTTSHIDGEPHSSKWWKVWR